MAEEKLDFESLLSRAKEQEKTYGWLDSSSLYKSALELAQKDNLFRKGHIQERRAYALFRAAMQAENIVEFKGRLGETMAQYGEAKESYSRTSSCESLPRISRCDAMIAYLGYWQTSEVATKKKKVSEAWSLAKKAMDAFGQSEILDLGKTYNELLLTAVLSIHFSDDQKVRIAILGEAITYGEKVAGLLSEAENPDELANTLVNLAGLLGAEQTMSVVGFDKKAINVQKVKEHWRRATGLSEETALVSNAFAMVAEDTLIMEMKEKQLVVERQLEFVRKTRDNLAIGATLGYLAYTFLWLAGGDDNPEDINAKLDKSLQHVHEARLHLDRIGFVVPEHGGNIWVSSPSQPWYFYQQARSEIDLRRKRELYLEFLKSARLELVAAEESGCPDVVRGAHFLVGSALVGLAGTERDKQHKARLLEEAVEHRIETSRLNSLLTPSNSWSRALFSCLAGEALLELAEITDCSETKKAHLDSSVSLMREGLDMFEVRLSVPHIAALTDATSYWRMSDGWFNYGRALRSSHELTGARESLVNSASAFERAAELAMKTSLLGRVGESLWEAARTYDSLGEHLKASERFDEASEQYRSASEKIKSLSQLYKDLHLYLKAWSEIEKARHHHTRQEPASAKEHYSKASELHGSTGQWNFLATNYLAWAQVENAEDLSQRDRCKEAIDAFKEAARLFKDSKGKMREQLGGVETNDEKQMVERLIDAAHNRQRFCEARITLEEARLLDKGGNSSSASEKYGVAADEFAKLKGGLVAEQDRREIELIITLSKAWKEMAKAEAEVSPEKYAEAARLFEKAKEFSPSEKAKALALGHSRFCKALEAGTRFADSRDPALHASAIKHLGSAANHYARAGAQSASEYSRASKLLFDAYASMDQANQESDHERKAKFYLAVEKTLEESADGFDKANQPAKKEQVLHLLEGVKRDRELAVSLTELFHAPIVVSSTASFASPTPTYEQPVGLERFEHGNVQANLSASKKDFELDENLDLKIELVNAGRGPAQLIKLHDFVPEGFSLAEEPRGYRMEEGYLNLRGKRLDPLKTEEIHLRLKPTQRGQFALKPRVLYLDGSGKYKSHEFEPMNVTVGVGAKSSSDKIFSTDTREAAEACAMLSGLSVVTLSHYRIVGNYVRYCGAVCNALKDARQKIVAACGSSSPKRENYVIWAPPGSGKTYFVQEVAALLGDSVHYRELNLAKLDEAGFRSGLAGLRDVRKPCLCLVDEVDAKPEEPWPYEALLPFLDASAIDGARFVFVLAGSSSSSLEGMKKAIASRPKGSDVLSRVPAGNEYTIPPMGVGDRLLVVLSQFRQAGKQMGREVREVEKLGLYYVAINPRLSNARQLREFAVRCAERVLPGDDRLKYDSLFQPGDRENKLFWTQALQSAGALVDTFLLVED